MSRLEKAYVWREEQGADSHNKYMKDNQQTNLKKPSHLCITPDSACTRACFLERGAAFFPLVPTAIGRVLVRVRVHEPIPLQAMLPLLTSVVLLKQVDFTKADVRQLGMLSSK